MTLSRRPSKDQPPADIRDGKTTTTTTDHTTHIPLPAVAPSIFCPDSDRCDTTGVPVSPLRPVINRFHPNVNILGREWIEVVWEMSGRLPQQCQERYRRVHILTEWTLVFLCVTFRGSPFIHYAPTSSLLCVYNDNRDSSSKTTPSPSLSYSVTHAHRSIGYRNHIQPLTESAATRNDNLRSHKNQFGDHGDRMTPAYDA